MRVHYDFLAFYLFVCSTKWREFHLLPLFAYLVGGWMLFYSQLLSAYLLECPMLPPTH